LECCLPVKAYVVSLLAGLLAGVLYGLLGVRSPAPPIVALLGLLGLLVGEQLATLGRRIVRGDAVSHAWLVGECVPQMTGVPAPPPASASAGATEKP
jgi:XapX domain-containing protein